MNKTKDEQMNVSNLEIFVLRPNRKTHYNVVKCIERRTQRKKKRKNWQLPRKSNYMQRHKNIVQWTSNKIGRQIRLNCMNKRFCRFFHGFPEYLKKNSFNSESRYISQPNVSTNIELQFIFLPFTCKTHYHERNSLLGLFFTFSAWIARSTFRHFEKQKKPTNYIFVTFTRLSHYIWWNCTEYL